MSWFNNQVRSDYGHAPKIDKRLGQDVKYTQDKTRKVAAHRAYDEFLEDNLNVGHRRHKKDKGRFPDKVGQWSEFESETPSLLQNP